MSNNTAINSNDLDDQVDQELINCLNIDNPKSFFLFAGAGSGKTRSLVRILEDFQDKYGYLFKLRRKQIAVITYTNAATDEITHRLRDESIFSVSTIHSFAWELIRGFDEDIKKWIRQNTIKEIDELEEKQSRSKSLTNTTAINRAKKIDRKRKRISDLKNINKFTYNPNSDSFSKDSLNHAEVIKIAAYFIEKSFLIQQLLLQQYPILLIDESQDTKRELMDAFLKFDASQKTFSLGLFGDTMQRIYNDGKIDLGKNLPENMVTPTKKMNHRSNKRIVQLINDIRRDVDGRKQFPRNDKEDGYVRLFICKRGLDKNSIEKKIANQMAQVTQDFQWKAESDDEKEVMTLILEHHMAARRMGFINLFEPLYKIDSIKKGLMDGTFAPIRFFLRTILPLIEAHKSKDKFELARIAKKYSKLFNDKDALLKKNSIDLIRNLNREIEEILKLWEDDKNPTLKDILKIVYERDIFLLPENLSVIGAQLCDLETSGDSDSEDESDKNDLIYALESALNSSFSELANYNKYISEDSKFDTHQGVKGLEFSRVMVIIDDEEARGFLFSYDKLFGAKPLSKTDENNIKEGKETGIDRTKRLFYVACSRAVESLAIIAYSDDVDTVKRNAIKNGWFKESEVMLILDVNQFHE